MTTITGTTQPTDISAASYAGKSFDPSAQVGSIEGVILSPDGTKLYVGDFNSGIIYQYALGTAKDISTAVYASKSLDVSAQIGATSLAGFALSNDGTKLYALSDNTAHIYQYTISTPRDISTGTYSTKNFSVATQVTNPFGIFYRADGKKFYVGDVASNNTYQYSIGTADDISTASYDSKSFDTTAQVGVADGICFSIDGTAFYNGDFNTGIFYEYAASPVWDISTSSYASKSLDASANLGASAQDILFSSDMQYLYLSNVTTNVIYQYAMPSPLTEQGDSTASSGAEIFTGSTVVTEQNDSEVSAGLAGLRGAVIYTEQNDSAASSGNEIFTGIVAATESNDSEASSGIETFTGSSAITEQNDSEISSGLTSIKGSADSTEQDDSVVAAGLDFALATALIYEDDDSETASGLEVITGTVSKTEQSDSEGAGGYISPFGSASITELSDLTVGHGRETFTGTTAVTEGNDSASGAALETVKGIAAPHEGADSSAASGVLVIRGAAAIHEKNDTAATVGREIFHGAAALTDDDDSMAAFGHSWFVATGGITEQNDSVVGIGFSAIRIAHVTPLAVILDKTYLNVMMDVL